MLTTWCWNTGVLITGTEDVLDKPKTASEATIGYNAADDNMAAKSDETPNQKEPILLVPHSLPLLAEQDKYTTPGSYIIYSYICMWV